MNTSRSAEFTKDPPTPQGGLREVRGTVTNTCGPDRAYASSLLLNKNWNRRPHHDHTPFFFRWERIVLVTRNNRAGGLSLKSSPPAAFAGRAWREQKAGGGLSFHSSQNGSLFSQNGYLKTHLQLHAFRLKSSRLRKKYVPLAEFTLTPQPPKGG